MSIRKQSNSNPHQPLALTPGSETETKKVVPLLCSQVL